MQNHSTFEGELSYFYYRGHQEFEISTQAVISGVENVVPAAKNIYRNNQWYPVPYPGFAFVAMVNESNNAQNLSHELYIIQKILLSILESPDTYVPLPQQSFHQTIANTFSASRFEKCISSTGMTDTFPSIIHSVLEGYPRNSGSGSVHLKLLGLALLGSAIGVLADVENEKEYDHILAVRNHLYSNEKLQSIGLKRTRSFIGHITLAYIEKILDTVAQLRLVYAINKVNKELAQKNFIFTISNAELRRYDNLAEFHAIDTIPPFAL